MTETAEIHVVDDDGNVIEVIEYLAGHKTLPKTDYKKAFAAFMSNPDTYLERLEAGEFWT